MGIGARFTTLHWPAVEWAMHALDLGVTANQNSIPRELVFDVDAMLDGRLDTVPFPFIGTNVPEGHQGQSVEGMSHGCVLSKLKTGFHRRRIAWSFNADHQPIGGKFDAREDALVRGCVLASYITFDLSPELAQTHAPADAAAWVRGHVPADLVDRVRARVASVGLRRSTTAEFAKLLASVWPALAKMKRRDDKYRAARETAFTTEVGRHYLRELSIDELPGLTTPETTAAMLSLCEALGMRIDFVAPAFGFQKNTPYPDNAELADAHRKTVGGVPRVRREHRLSLRIGKVGRKLPGDGRGHRRTSRDQDERPIHVRDGRRAVDVEEPVRMRRSGVTGTSSRSIWRSPARSAAIRPSRRWRARSSRHALGPPPKTGARMDLFDSPTSCRRALEALPPSPEYMFFFEYNFLFVLAAGGRPDKTALGDHSPAGYAQRARFYSISPEARLNFAKAVADYIVFLAATTGLVEANRCATAAARLERYSSLDEMLAEI